MVTFPSIQNMKTHQLLVTITISSLLCNCAGTNLRNMVSTPDAVSVYSRPETDKVTGKLYSEAYTYEVDEPWYVVFAGTGFMRRISLTRTDSAPTKHYLTSSEVTLQKVANEKMPISCDYFKLRTLPGCSTYTPEQQHLTVNSMISHPLRSEYILWGHSSDAPHTPISTQPETITLYANGDTPLNGMQKWSYADRILSLPLMLTPIGAVLMLYEWCIFENN